VSAADRGRAGAFGAGFSSTQDGGPLVDLPGCGRAAVLPAAVPTADFFPTVAGMRPARILVVDDNAGDARLTLEALREAAVGAEVAAVPDGEEALAYLRGEGAHAGAPRPDLVLLDLNLPRRDGREVLAEIKSDPALHAIPVIVLSTSAAPHDVSESYANHANAYLVKPIGLDEFTQLVRSIDAFWLRAARLPER